MICVGMRTHVHVRARARNINWKQIKSEGIRSNFTERLSNKDGAAPKPNVQYPLI